MKLLKMIPAALVALTSISAVRADTPTIVCKDSPRSTSGLVVVIQSTCTTAQATVTYRQGLGPVENLGSLYLGIKSVPAGIVGAGVTYEGDHFELKLNTDWTPRPDGISSHIKAELRGLTFDEDLLCNYLSQ